jgi:hypothetical protein
LKKGEENPFVLEITGSGLQSGIERGVSVVGYVMSIVQMVLYTVPMMAFLMQRWKSVKGVVFVIENAGWEQSAW